MAWTIFSQLQCWCTSVHLNKDTENKTQQQLSISLMTPRFRPQRSPPLEEHNISLRCPRETPPLHCAESKPMYLRDNIPTNHSSGSFSFGFVWFTQIYILREVSLFSITNRQNYHLESQGTLATVLLSVTASAQKSRTVCKSFFFSSILT